ncbi:DUF3742 family protein [Salmonella enterica]|nr:DUF3742 family protein [Salmonella enterica]
MNNVDKIPAAERAGQTVGRWLKSVIRLESALLHRIAATGVPRWLVLMLKWVIRLVLVLVFFYIAFVPALVVLMLSIVFFLQHRDGYEASNDEEYQKNAAFYEQTAENEEALKPQLRDGHSGWGWYSHDDQALDIEYPDDFV